MSELKPCPFCGSKPEKVQVVGDSRFYYSCLNFMCPRGGWSKLDQWNSRPIEDALLKRAERAEAMVEKLTEAGGALCDYAILVSFDHPMGDGQMALNDKSAWDALVTEWQKERETC